ncbi:hypothetical protein G7Z17_g12351 [Cylindrodendrum hubeiense]|uniref:Uncharacterized protein n=1 Tax=Cylindrodendrum hubeiense TaxID=595255 RepID=A0A9P5L9C2_9HYPO|nr:hypothetical protein G7Z17_g12351 [Cylindrodendrum hubeiense]
MSYRFTLPIRPRPNAPLHDHESSSTKTMSETEPIPTCGLKRSPLLSRRRSDPRGRIVTRHRLGQENSRPETGKNNIASGAPSDFDPADSNTWTANPPPFLHNDALFPLPPHEHTQDEQAV